MSYDPKKIMSRRSIQEFRIGFMLEEEFYCDPEFVREFAKACGFDHADLKFESSVLEFKIDSSGYGDLLVCLRGQSATAETMRLALLIENKINAGAQPGQAERYCACGVNGLVERWDEYKTVLVAPDKYRGEKNDYDIFVSLEDVCKIICKNEPNRAEFRKKKFRDAIEKQSMNGIQIIDQPLTDFRAAYFNYVHDFNERHGTNFECDKPRPAYDGDSWLHLGSSDFVGDCRIRHKLWTSRKDATGQIELGFLRTDFLQASALAAFTDQDMRFSPAGAHEQHVAIALQVPEIRDSAAFESVQSSVEQALTAAKRLWRMYCKNKQDIDEIVLAARQKQSSKANSS